MDSVRRPTWRAAGRAQVAARARARAAARAFVLGGPLGFGASSAAAGGDQSFAGDVAAPPPCSASARAGAAAARLGRRRRRPPSRSGPPAGARRRRRRAPPAEQAPTPAGRVCVVAAAFKYPSGRRLACAAGDRRAVHDGRRRVVSWVEVVARPTARGRRPLSYLQ